MDSDLSPAQQNNESKAEFRKLTNEATNRKYRRHSSASGLSEEDGSPKREHYSKVSSKSIRHYDKEDDSSSHRSQHGHSSDSYRHSSRGHRHDDHFRYGKHAGEDDRSSAKRRESRAGAKSDYRERDGDYHRSRDRYRDVDRYPRDTRYDGRHGGRHDDRERRYSRDRDRLKDEREDYKASRVHRGNGMSDEYFKGHPSDCNSRKEIGDKQDLNSSKLNQESSKTESPEVFAAKRPKFSSSSDSTKDENILFKQANDLASKVSPEQGSISGAGSVSSVNDAAVRAMKAAQSVNQNLTSMGFMTAIDSKKKLLWADKKIKATDESSNRWDATQFTDRERLEKFYKLMGVKGEVKVDPKPLSSQDAEKQRELQLELEKQYTAGLRRRDGRTVGLGL